MAKIDKNVKNSVIINKFIHTINSAHRRNKEFSLTLLYLTNLLKQTHCAYSGEKFGENEDKLTLERINNNIGYVDGNVIAVKDKYNSLRGSYTIQELVDKLYESKSVNDMCVTENPLDEKNKNRLLEIEKRKLSISSKTTKIKNIKKILNDYENKKNALNTNEHDEKIKELSSIIERHLKTIKISEKNIISLNLKVQEYLSLPAPVVKKERALNQEEIESLSILIKGISKIETLSWSQRLRVSVGLALDTPLITTLKMKLIYNLLRGEL